MAEAFLEVLLENLSSMIQKEIGVLFGTEKEMKRLSSILSTIRAVLEDAEEKQLSNRAIRDWLLKLKDAALQLDNILDEISTESLRLEYQRLKHGPLSKLSRSFLSSLHPNNVLFRHEVAKKMKDIRETLDEIAQERSKFHLSEVIIEKSAQVLECRETTSMITQSQVYGRDIDKEKIVDFLIGDATKSKDLLVYPIVGIGGIGKTTLAQLVFNDDKISDHFDLKIWVCVSEDFSMRTLLKAIIGAGSTYLNLESLQRDVQWKLGMKRYLLVLDDVWNEDQDEWEKLKCVLSCGSKGASMVVTTRLLKVASIMGTTLPHELSTLSDDDCWSLLKERAFGMGNEEYTELVPVGKEIVKKCSGVPLAAKALGGLLRFKSDKREWVYIKESKLWDLPQSENTILPALRLSYLNLPLNLRQCFSYCAIFPKNFFIRKELLIHLWMANGFISSRGMLMAEDIGDQVFHELCWRSFFQDFRTDNFGNETFKMHDLFHDLAQWIMAETCCVWDYSLRDLSRTIHHLSVDFNLSRTFHHLSVDVFMSSEPCVLSLDQLQRLRTYMVFRSIGDSAHYSMKFRYLRVLYHSRLKVVPQSISHLKHLRYLNLSFGDFKTLPKCICCLWNLQILNLDNCAKLKKLPPNMKCLKSLSHLHMRHCISLSSMPPKMGQLTCLRVLNTYVVSKNKKGYLLEELKYLKLRGELHIKHLERVASVMDAKEANLASKELDQLFLSWGRNSKSELQENVEEILEALEPHPQLKDLRIGGYNGEHFSKWMSNPTLKNLCFIELVDCKNSVALSELGKLPSLEELKIHNLSSLRFIDDESYGGGGTATSFKSLQCLIMTYLSNLEGLSKEEREDMFPSLSTIKIGRCPKLTLPHHPSVIELKIDESPRIQSSTGERAPLSLPSNNDPSTKRSFLCSINKLHGLQGLWLCNDEELSLFPEGMLQDLNCLKELHILFYEKLEALPADDFIHLHALQELHIRLCPSLEYIPQQVLQGLRSLQTLEFLHCYKLKRLSMGFQYLTSLKNLTIDKCPEMEDLATALQHVPCLESLTLASLPNLEPFPDWLESLTSLQCLAIYECERLVSLPMSIQNLTSLKKLEIGQCPELLKRCEKETGEDWHKIAHIPNIYRNFYPAVIIHRSICINKRDI